MAIKLIHQTELLSLLRLLHLISLCTIQLLSIAHSFQQLYSPLNRSESHFHSRDPTSFAHRKRNTLNDHGDHPTFRGTSFPPSRPTRFLSPSETDSPRRSENDQPSSRSSKAPFDALRSNILTIRNRRGCQYRRFEVRI